MPEIIIIQHCQSEHHLNNMTGGWTDSALTDLGRKQANLIGFRLKKEIIPANYILYSSDLKRALQTAEIVGNILDLEVILNQDLREINTGIAKGQTKEWAKTHRNPEIRQGYDLDYQEFSQGETRREFFTRTCNCMENLRELNKNLIVVTHGGSVANILAWWVFSNEYQREQVYFAASPGSVSILRDQQNNRHMITLFNDISHLKSIL